MPKRKEVNQNVKGLQAKVLEQPITDTLELNYMPYAMSVIVSRAIPEIDGFKPSHRKLLYTMYKMGLLTGARTKSANIVGQTMRLNPHGDGPIYDTLVRLSKGYGALLAPFIDSKGNFGKVFSRDMAYAASRYTEAKLSQICGEIFRDIDKETVDFTDNYDSTMKEPALLPTTFPNVLVSANTGIAVGMASNICGFNLDEVCRTAIEYIGNKECDLALTLKAPDFPTGGELIYNAEELESIYNTGRGSVKVRAKWKYVKEGNLIEITEIPYSTTAESIIDKVAELVKANKLKEIADMRDETDLSGLKLTIELKRGTNPDNLMAKLYKQTPLMDSFSCNFNILIAGVPRVMGVREILEEWTAWRADCVKRRVYCDMQKKKEKLHLLRGLQKILLDIDKAIKIIRETDEESEVVPNLMIGFGIDEQQADYVAEIRLRNINREHILKRTQETDDLEKEIADLEAILASSRRINSIIIKELKEVLEKYAQPRRTRIVYEDEIEEFDIEEHIEDYQVNIFMSREGYFKKITPLSLRMGGEHKYKDSDGPFISFSAQNRSELLVFTDKQQVYKARVHDFEDSKASNLGTYLPTALEMDEGENVIFLLDPGGYKDHIIFFFENGKAARVELAGYATKLNRKKLTGAYSDKSPVSTVMPLSEDKEVAVFSSDGRVVVYNTSIMAPKTTRNTQGVGVMSLKKNRKVEKALPLDETDIQRPERYRVRAVPAAGALLKPEDKGEEQLKFLQEEA
ncbi:MAG: DNA topoisomerase (ATP-hydrolyzing) subunit A [Oscillospiraceae bacterium]|nr:DNA topoisomerase (ATP-hydrolyzing) subunit A [Oscillospiraceae bacterium]MCL2278466.1 DNA topoisomerase (ATP-hydrolyzing) subunit A [Oscillospiraceae bacterium]